MSSYENYSRTAQHYDKTRIPVGVEVILGCFSQLGRTLGELTVLDAGCGTGSYARAVVDHVARVEAVDLNEAMLGAAREKLASAEREGRARFWHAAIDELPLEDGSVDAVMINQVLHHLPDDADGGWPRTTRVFEEFARVLRPGGGVVVNICSHEQLRYGAWYYALLEEQVERMCAMHVGLEELAGLMTSAGFRYRERYVPIEGLMQGEHYFNARGPLEQAWRDGDSIWSLLSDAQLEDVVARVRALDAAGRLEAFVRENDARRRSIGQIGFSFATLA